MSVDSSDCSTGFTTVDLPAGVHRGRGENPEATPIFCATPEIGVVLVPPTILALDAVARGTGRSVDRELAVWIQRR